MLPRADWSRGTGAAVAVTSPAGSGDVPGGDFGQERNRASDSGTSICVAGAFLECLEHEIGVLGEDTEASENMGQLVAIFRLRRLGRVNAHQAVAAAKIEDFVGGVEFHERQ